MNIYVTRDGQNYGPYTPEQAHAMIAQGQLYPGDMACPEGQQQWVPLGQILGIPPTAAAAPLSPGARPAIPVAQPASAVHPPAYPPSAPAPAAGSQMSPAAHFAIQHAYSAACGAYSMLGLAAALGFIGLGLPAIAWAAERAPDNAVTTFFGETLGVKTAAIGGGCLAVLCILWFIAQRKKASAAKTRFVTLRSSGL